MSAAHGAQRRAPGRAPLRHQPADCSRESTTGPLRALLHAHPPLAARFRAVIDFPGYTPAQLAVIVTALAGEAGLVLTTAARAKAADVLARAGEGRGPGNARLAVGLLNQATAAQARRVAAGPPRDRRPAALTTITEADIPDRLQPGASLPDAALDDHRPGQYL